MKRISSIKHKSLALLISLTLGLTVFYLALAVITGFVVEDVIISKLLEKHVNYAETHYQKKGTLPNLDLDFITLYENPSALPKALYQSISQSTGDREIFTPNNTHYHFKTLNLGNEHKGYIVAEVSDLLVVSQNPSIFNIYAIGLVIALLLAIYLAKQFSSQIVNPIILLTQAIKSSQIGKQNQPLPKFKYELGYLSNTFQNAFMGLEQALTREKNFTTDVGHELRTPLTILKNSIALIEHRGYKQSDLTDIKRLSVGMENTVTVLLALARAESVEKQSCNVNMLLEQTVVNLCQSDDIDITIDIPTQFALMANPILLSLLFNNLVSNAIEHAHTHKVTITQRDNTLSFLNSVQGPIINDIASSGIKSENSKGVGQGLYLVTRIVEAFNWHYELKQSNNTFIFSIFYH